MSQSKNLLSEFNVTDTHSASYWQKRMMALKVGGLDDFRIALDAALKSDNPAIVEEAQRALRVLKRITQELGVTREAVEKIFRRLQGQYLETRNTTTKGMKIKRGTPAAAVYKEFPSLYATCHAHAEASLPLLNAEIGKQDIPLVEEEEPRVTIQKKKPAPASAEIGLADEEGTVTPKKADPLSQDQGAPESTGDYAVDLGEPGPAAEEIECVDDTGGYPVDYDADLAKILDQEPSPSPKKGSSRPPKKK